MNKPFQHLVFAFLLCLFLPQSSRADTAPSGPGTNNPTGVTGEYNGSIMTAGSYDPFTGNATRTVRDLTVPGSVGVYPLEFKRILNTRGGTGPLGNGGGWKHNYQWALRISHPVIIPGGWSGCFEQPPDATLTYPDGAKRDLRHLEDDTWQQMSGDDAMGDRLVRAAGGGDNYDLRLKDGGIVEFRNITPHYSHPARAIVDPYKQRTTLGYDPATGLLSTVTEPAGRFLQIHYMTDSYETDTNPPRRVTVHYIDRVEAWDGLGHLMEKVVYNYETEQPQYSAKFWNLTTVTYDDDLQAVYHYDPPRETVPGNHYTKFPGRVHTCKDWRFEGPMKQIMYEYVPITNSGCLTVSGQILSEKNVNGQVLSTVEYPYTGFCLNIPTSRTETRPDGASRIIYYDGGEVTSYTDFANPARGETQHSTTITYNNDSEPYGYYARIVTDAYLRATTTFKDWNTGAVIAVKHADNSWVNYSYQDSWDPHYVSARKDENNKWTYFDRNLQTHQIEGIYYPDGGFETFTYDNNPFGLVHEHRMTSGGTEIFTYTPRGLKETHTAPATQADPTPRPTRYAYYDASNDPSGHKIDRLLSVTDPLLHTTTFDYDARGQVTRTTHHDGKYTETRYNDDGTVERVIDELTHITRYEYDEYKRIRKVINVVNGADQVTESQYNPPGLSPLSHTSSSVFHVITPTLKTAEYDYDSNFRRTRMTLAPGVSADEATTNFFYDSVGRLYRTEDPRHKFTTYGYNERNRRTSVWNEELNETTLIRYDFVGNKTGETRPDLAVRSWDYDEMNRLAHAYDWRGPTDAPEAYQRTEYMSDFAGNVHKITDAKGAVYECNYDERNQKIGAIYPQDANGIVRSETWKYDGAGNLLEYTNPAEQVRRFHYDNRNRQDESWWIANEGPHIVTRYDFASRVTKILATGARSGVMAIQAPDEVSFETMVSFGYDEANRKLWEEQTVIGHETQRVETALNDDGTRRTLQITHPPVMGGGLVDSLEMPDSGTYSVEYERTARNQLKRLFATDGAWAFDYLYDPAGNMTNRSASSYGGHQSSTSCPNYDALNRPKQWEQRAVNVLFSKSHYKYDKANREEATWRDENNYFDAGKGERFSFTANNQITAVAYDAYNVENGPPTDAARTVSYGYTVDKLNRTRMTDGNVVTNYTNPSGINQYASVGQVQYQYDNNFNLRFSGDFTGTFDAMNHLVSADQSADHVEFIYDGLGRCVKRTLNGVETVLLYDEWKPIAEWDGWADYFQAWNVYGPGADEILLRQQAKYGYIRFHLDPHGNVEFLVDNDGHVQEQYTYDVFGAPTVRDWDGGHAIRPWSYFGHRFQFQGREYLHEFGIYDYRNRFYYPGSARFLQVDPTNFDGGDANLFRYCGDDPIDGSDPMGLADQTKESEPMLPKGWYAEASDGRIYKPNQDNFRPDATGTTDRVFVTTPREPGSSWAPGDRGPSDRGIRNVESGRGNPYRESAPFIAYYGKGFDGPGMRRTAAVIETAATIYVAVGVGGMVAVETGAGAALAPVRVDGPQRGGRIAQLRYGNVPLLRLDYHKIPGSGGAPRLHLNVGPGKGRSSIHIPLDPRSWGD